MLYSCGIMHAMDENESNSISRSDSTTPLYERPGRLDPDRHVPITRQDRVDVNIHYDDKQKAFVTDADSPEFTEGSVNAMNPFEDRALLKGDVKPKSTGIRTDVFKFESKIFVPEIDTSEVKAKIKKTAVEPEQPVYIAEEDKAASSDYIADAMSGVEEETAGSKKTGFAIVDASRLKFLVYLLAIVIVVEIAGIALLILL